MYAIVDCRGEQVTVRPGEIVSVPHMDGNEGDKISLDRVLLLGGDNQSIGAPLVEGARVTATIQTQAREPKITVFRMKRRTKYRRTRGHRQPRTVIQIDQIET